MPLKRWALSLLLGVFVAVSCSGVTEAVELSGHYMESRTCQVYTGPCFANAEVGLAGKNAVMAWHISEGSHAGVDLTGLNVVMALGTTKTLAFRGISEAGDVKSVIYVDKRATESQQLALADFAKEHSGAAGKNVLRVSAAPIEMNLNVGTLSGKLNVEKAVQLETRKARPDDCICSNESAYYPPLTDVTHFAPGVATVGEFKGRGLGSRWSTPGARSVYMGTFEY